MSEIKSWIKENQTLLGFLMLQAIAIVAYAVRLETRVSILETRGAAFTIQRMDEMKRQITVLEEKIDKNEGSINRIVEILTRNLPNVQREISK